MAKNKSVNILFLGGAKRVSLGEIFLKAGRELGVRINVLSYELDKRVPISLLAKEIIIGLRWEDKKIDEHLIATIEKYDIDIVLPLVDPSILVAARLKERVKDRLILVSDELVCKRFFDKIEANNWFEKNGFLIPENTNELPMIAKIRKGSASKGLFIIRTEADKAYFFSNFDRDNYLLQRFIDGDEFSVDCFVSNKGKMGSIVPRKRIEVTSGEVTKSMTVRDYEIIRLARDIIIKSKCIGPLTIQIMKEKNSNKLFILEINPRFGGGVIVSIEAGANTPLLLLKDYLNIPYEFISDWRENLLMVRAYREVFYYANNH